MTTETLRIAVGANSTDLMRKAMACLPPPWFPVGFAVTASVLGSVPWGRRLPFRSLEARRIPAIAWNHRADSHTMRKFRERREEATCLAPASAPSIRDTPAGIAIGLMKVPQPHPAMPQAMATHRQDSHPRTLDYHGQNVHPCLVPAAALNISTAIRRSSIRRHRHGTAENGLCRLIVRSQHNCRFSQ